MHKIILNYERFWNAINIMIFSRHPRDPLPPVPDEEPSTSADSSTGSKPGKRSSNTRSNCEEVRPELHGKRRKRINHYHNLYSRSFKDIECTCTTVYVYSVNNCMRSILVSIVTQRGTRSIRKVSHAQY